MVGRHRSGKGSRKLPAIVAGVAIFLLAFTVWITGGPWQPDTSSMAAQFTAPATSAPPPVVTPPSSTTTTPPPPPPPSTTTTTTRPPSTTTTPRSTSTTKPSRACSSVLDGTKPHVAQVGNYLDGLFPIDSIGGRASRSGTSDHPGGLALDFMVDTATGNKLAEFVLANQSRLGVKYVIWRQRYNDGSGWSMMEDRGSATANHYDHVHVSFLTSARVSVSC